MRHLVPMAMVLSCCMSAAEAQPAEQGRAPRFRLGGVRLEPAIVSPKDADTGFQIGGSLALGTIFAPWLHFNASAGRWSADLDGGDQGESIAGTVSDVFVGADLRWAPVGLGRFRPYLLTGLAGHFVGADVPASQALEDALAGFSTGVDVGAGLRTRGVGLGSAFEVRRRFIDDVGNWTFQFGIGWTFGGSDTRPKGGQAVVVPAATTAPYVAVPAAPRADGADVRHLEMIAQAMRALADENRALRADLDSLRRTMERGTLPRSVVPEGALEGGPRPPGAPAGSDAVRSADDARDSLVQALRRLDVVRENPDAVVETASGVRLALAGTFAFESGGTALSVPARTVLRRVALVLLRHEEVTVRVDGHADAWGEPEINERISRERAEAVRDELLALGIAPARIEVRGMGSKHPIADNRTAAGRARNRRVEMTFEIE